MPKIFDIEALEASKAKIGGDIVSKTLDTLNSGQFGSSGKCSGSNKISNTYHLSKSVLSSVYQGKGSVVSTKG